MVICTNCQSRQLDGTIFCDACGATILALTPREKTVALSSHDIIPALAPTSPAMPPAATAVDAPARRLVVIVHASGRRFLVEADQPALIGRRDEARGVIPLVELSDEGGYEAGVSRRHAVVSVCKGRFYVEDLGSANGTFLNDQQLSAHTPTVLSDGDELRCGMLLLRIEIDR